MPLIEAHDLTRTYRTRALFGKTSELTAVDGVSLHVEAGKTLAIVGESGCGKSTLGRLLLGLDRPSAGHVLFDGIDLGGANSAALRRVRRDMQLVFQNALAALDPRMAVGMQIGEPLDIHGISSNEPRKVAIERLMRQVGLDPSLASRRPGELSGGQRQRVVIARALATSPRFVVFDEAVSALDVSVQAQIIALIRELQAAQGFASAFISHDLRVVRHVADRVAVMYLGRIVEYGDVRRVFNAPAHPYTRALLSAIPALKPASGSERIRLAGDPPDPANLPTGCAFHPRCPVAVGRCSEDVPLRHIVGIHHDAACHLVQPGMTIHPSQSSLSQHYEKNASCAS